jgi:hypothetical protein
MCLLSLISSQGLMIGLERERLFFSCTTRFVKNNPLFDDNEEVEFEFEVVLL